MPKKVKTARGRRKTRKTNTLKVRVYKKYNNKRGGENPITPDTLPAANVFPINIGAVKPQLPQLHIPVPTPVPTTLFATAFLFSSGSDKENIDPALAELYKTDFFRTIYPAFSSIFPKLDQKKFAVILLTYIAALKNAPSDNQTESEIILPQGGTDNAPAVLLSDLKRLVDAIHDDISKRHQTRTGRTPQRSSKNTTPKRGRRHTYGGGSQYAEIGISGLIMYLLRYLPARYRGNVRIVFAFIFMLWGIILIYNAVDALFNIDDYMDAQVRRAHDNFVSRVNTAASAALVPYGAQVTAELQLQAPPIHATSNSLHINFADIFSPGAQGELVNRLVGNIGRMMERIIISPEYLQFQGRLQELMNNVGQAVHASSAAHRRHENVDVDAGIFTIVLNSLQYVVGRLAAIRYNVQHADEIVNHVISSGQAETTRLFANLLADLTRTTQNLSAQLRVHIGSNFDNLMIGTYMAVGYLLHILYDVYRRFQERRQQQEQRQIRNE
jgi:hypothetical protein